MNNYVIGDIHGNYKGLVQAIERSPFNPELDNLIILGDLVDGGPDSAEVIEYLSSLPNYILIKGNHDDWFTHWINYGIHPCSWMQGGYHTAKSYIEYVKLETGEDRKIISEGYSAYKCDLTYNDIPVKHRLFLNSAVDYYIHDNMCFVHGGFNRHYELKEQDSTLFYWDRDLWASAMSYENTPNKMGHGKFKIKDDFKDIFIGHTTTLNWNTTEPMFAANIINLDTGAGFAGKVTIMNVDTKEYWQSDLVEELYGQNFRR